MNQTTISSILLSCLLLISGCSVKEPQGTSDAKASAAWINYCIKKAGKAKSMNERISWNRKAYDHAVLMKAAAQPEFMTKVQSIPQHVYTDSINAENLHAFKWSLSQDIRPDSHYLELTKLWELGRDWRTTVFPVLPDALPVFMSEAIDHYNVKFFNQHAEAFKQTGFKVKSPLQPVEFNIRYRRFIGEQLEEALIRKDDERIAFLINQIPPVGAEAYMDERTQERIKKTGDYLTHEKNDERLTAKLMELGFQLNKPDLQNGSFSAEFLETLRANPDNAVKTLQLSEWNGPLSDAEVDFILTLPPETWHALHKVHVDETIEICMAKNKSTEAMQFIQLRAERAPLTRGDYNELMNWSLKHGDKTVFDFVMEQNGDIDIYSIDLGSLAHNQKLFEFYAPKIMNKIYYTLDTEPRTDGTTFGHIYKVFACRKNEKAGLFMVSRYDLSQAWLKATDGRTLLMDVCRAGNLLSARYLIEKREANLHASTGYSELQISMFGRTRPTEGKLTPIFFAAKSGNSELIRYLASKGANINGRSNYHTTPLMHAVTAGHIDAVKTFITLGANVQAEMDPNINQVDLREMGSYDDIANACRRARSIGREDILELLKQAGARP